MIFLTVGSELPFNRITEAMDQFVADHPDVEVVAQVGKLGEGDYVPKYMNYLELLTPDQYSENMQKADIIVGHAGMGSIISSVTAKKPIVILPRRGHLKETRNDHQYATSKKFADKNGVFVAWEQENLAEQIELAIQSLEGDSLAVASSFANQDLLDNLKIFFSN